MKTIYLAGPITGQSYGSATDWREHFPDILDKIAGNSLSYAYLEPIYRYIQCMSPMRHKDYLLNETTIGDSYEEQVMSSQRGITARDRNDCIKADVIIVNVLGATRVSIGTMIEMGWADANRVPIILVMEKDGNIHEHAMVRELAPFRVTTIEEAALVAYKLLMP